MGRKRPGLSGPVPASCASGRDGTCASAGYRTDGIGPSQPKGALCIARSQSSTATTRYLSRNLVLCPHSCDATISAPPPSQPRRVGGSYPLPLRAMRYP